MERNEALCSGEIEKTELVEKLIQTRFMKQENEARRVTQPRLAGCGQLVTFKISILFLNQFINQHTEVFLSSFTYLLWLRCIETPNSVPWLFLGCGNKNWRSLGELRLEFFEPPRSIEITVLAQFITFWLDHVIGSDLLSESNKLCKHSEPRCGEEGVEVFHILIRFA